MLVLRLKKNPGYDIIYNTGTEPQHVNFGDKTKLKKK